jgi:acyl-CoA thioesterase-1
MEPEMTDARACIPHSSLVAFDYPLRYFQESLKRRRKTRIVAMGSSSTAGANNVLPYPGRLEFLLRQAPGQFGRIIDVVNRGIGGQESPEELSRFECDVIAEDPSLVIWQVGTNAVFHPDCYNPDEVARAIEIGLDLIANIPADVILMDLQYTVAMAGTPDKLKLSEQIEGRIVQIAAQAKVNVFKRWQLMKTWRNEDGVPLETLDDNGGDHLHMSDWATACMTEALCHAIVSAPAV